MKKKNLHLNISEERKKERKKERNKKQIINRKTKSEKIRAKREFNRKRTSCFLFYA